MGRRWVFSSKRGGEPYKAGTIDAYIRDGIIGSVGGDHCDLVLHGVGTSEICITKMLVYRVPSLLKRQFHVPYAIVPGINVVEVVPEAVRYSDRLFSCLYPDPHDGVAWVVQFTLNPSAAYDYAIKWKRVALVSRHVVMQKKLFGSALRPDWLKRAASEKVYARVFTGRQ